MADSTAATKPQDPPLPCSDEDTLRIVLAGSGGASKSTLMRTVFDFVGEIPPGRSQTRRPTKSKYSMNLVITDNVGLQTDGTSTGNGTRWKIWTRRRSAKRKEKLPALTTETFPPEKPDLLIYCLCVDASSRFKDGNPAIMKRLQDEYGQDLWNRSVLVLSLSNKVWEGILQKHERTEAIQQYIAHLTEHATQFEEELNHLTDSSVPVTLTFTTQPATDDPSIIPAIPAGEEPYDEVFPDDDESEYLWRDVFIFKLIKSSDRKMQQCLLQYLYGQEKAQEVLQSWGFDSSTSKTPPPDNSFAAVLVGMVVGGVLGGVIGTMVGIPVGTLGGTTGGVVGGVMGGVVGGVIGRMVKELLQDN